MQDTQIAALKRENKKRREVYSKTFSNTLKCHKHALIDLMSNGFLLLNEYIHCKGISVKYNKPTPSKADKTSLQEKLEKSSNNALSGSRSECTGSRHLQSLRGVGEELWWSLRILFGRAFIFAWFMAVLSILPGLHSKHIGSRHLHIPQHQQCLGDEIWRRLWESTQYLAPSWRQRQ